MTLQGSSFRLERVTLRGFKSFREAELEIRPINVLIGANGAGKSNFVGLFHLVNRMMNEGLQRYVAQAGWADQILHYGRKTTERLWIELVFAKGEGRYANGYQCELIPTAEGTLVFGEERVFFHDRSRYNRPYDETLGDVHPETLLPEWAQHNPIARHTLHALRSWQVYHFHDTSEAAKVKQFGDLHDNQFLRPDASNLAAYLFLLQQTQPKYYQRIVENVRMIAPFFGDFVLRPSPFNPDTIRLEWQERGTDITFGPQALSDGTLRFMCLATLFLQPPEQLPATLVLDEPELGLHPAAITLLAEMVRMASRHTQVILATQSVTLVNQFAPEDIVVVEREGGETLFRRFTSEEVEAWLDEYAVGDLWEKNLLGGRPKR